jgi:hypothetical protein
MYLQIECRVGGDAREVGASGICSDRSRSIGFEVERVESGWRADAREARESRRPALIMHARSIKRTADVQGMEDPPLVVVTLFQEP